MLYYVTPEERSEYIDAKLAAVAESLELLTHDVHALQEQQRLQDARERKGRTALLLGMQAYLKAFNENGDENGEA